MAPLVNTRGPIFTHPGGIVLRTTYHVLWMFANLLEANVVSAWAESDPFECGQQAVPALDAIATCDDSQARWRILVVNRDDTRELACRVRREGREIDGPLEATLLTADTADAFNDIDHSARVAPVRKRLEVSNGAVILPPHSIAALSLDGTPVPQR